MNQVRTRPSLRTRIEEAQARATYTAARSYVPPRREGSFVEQYQGTEYERPVTMLTMREPLVTRGRSFVLVIGAVVGTVGILVAAGPA